MNRELQKKSWSRSIASRRFFFLIGTLSLYRCIILYVTTLPITGMPVTCTPKQFHGNTRSKLQRILGLGLSGGVSMTNADLLCGDLICSGYTVMLVLTYLCIQEYSPQFPWWYHRICWLLSATGVVCILVAHEHLFLDVLVSYAVTSRLFLWYHTMANLQTQNRLNNSWLKPLFIILEGNIKTSVPHTYSWPSVCFWPERSGRWGTDRNPA